MKSSFKFIFIVAIVLSMSSGFSHASDLKFRKENKNYVLILSPGQKIIESLKAFAEKEKIKGASFTAIGGVKNAEVAYYNLNTKVYQPKKFEEPMEVLSFIGNIGQFEKKPIVHGHITLSGPDYKVMGGHLMDAEVTVTFEIFITPMKNALIRELNHDFPNTKLINLSTK